MPPRLEFINTPIPPLIRRLAIPTSAGFFFNTIFNVVDTIYAGQISTLAQAGLASLGDWTARPDLTYTQALYSTNGQALVAADCKNYAIADVTMPYFSLGITLCAEENLPRRMT